MSSSKNLAQMFAQANAQQPPQRPSLSGSRSDVYSSHHSTSKAVDATDDNHFESTTFQLKRTRSMGLLDEFIAPTRKLLEEDEEDQDQPHEEELVPQHLQLNFDDDDDNNAQFIENVDDLPEQPAQPKNKNVIYTYDGDEEDDDDDDDNSLYNTSNSSQQQQQPPRAETMSPSPPSSPDLHQPHDDNDIQYEPSRHVDYLSHDWKESDISKSWRYIVLKRKDVANSARLENASWRTWAQAKYHLKTISPESVNWLKDSDVTWLYGPLYKEKDTNDFDRAYGSDGECDSSTLNAIKREQKKKPSTTPGSQSSPSTKQQRLNHLAPKPILKKRTVSEMLTQSAPKLPHHHPVHVPSPPVVQDDFDMISKRVNAQYTSSKRPDSPASATPQPSDSSTALDSTQQAKRHIHFNDRVEQCIALDYVSDNEDGFDDYDNDNNDYNDHDDNDDAEDEYNEDEEEDSDSDDEGGFFLNVRSPSSAQLHKLGIEAEDNGDEEGEDVASETASRSTKSSRSKLRECKTIEWLPATTLKYGSDEEETDDDDKYAVSHRIDTSRGYNYHYDYNSVFTADQNSTLIHLGNNDYEVEGTPQHLEGVNMVDVPDNIVLGSNVEVMDVPESLSVASGAISPPISVAASAVSIPQNTSSNVNIPQNTSSIKRTNSGFALHSDDDDSSGEEDGAPVQQTPSPSTAKNITKISSSPSCASLSDVAAQGYITQGSPTDLDGLQREFSNLSSGGSNASAEHHEGASPKSALNFKNTLFWKKN